MKPLDDLLAEGDAISLALVDNEETVGFLSRERITKLKEGVIVVNTASRTLVDEEAMAEALKSGRVDSYVQECDDVTSPPLGNLENAFLFKVFGWYTKEALERNFDIWIDNIEGILKGAPVNPV
jgi:lactate dehydrogenase-like 2-hydroxyacid dehydrogenase